MSDIRHTHPGYFQVTLGLALTWYLGLGVAFSLKDGPGRSQTYKLIDAYVPIHAWGLIYLTLGAGLLIAITVTPVPHTYVRLCCGIGLMLTSFWLTIFITALAIGKLDLTTAIPAWATVALVEWAGFREPEGGPHA